MRPYVLAAVALVGLAGFAQESDAAVLAARVTEGVKEVATTSSTNGTLFLVASTSNFSQISLTGFGLPIAIGSDLIGQTTDISSAASFSGTQTLKLELTQTDVTSASMGGLLAVLATTLTANLSSSAISNVTISSYADATNAQYGTGTLLASRSFTGTGPSGPFVTSTPVALPNALFSETLVITATFTGGGATLNAAAQIAKGTPVAVPEPASIALFSTGLLAVGMLSRRRRQG